MYHIPPEGPKCICTYRTEEGESAWVNIDAISTFYISKCDVLPENFWIRLHTGEKVIQIFGNEALQAATYLLGHNPVERLHQAKG